MLIVWLLALRAAADGRVVSDSWPHDTCGQLIDVTFSIGCGCHAAGAAHQHMRTHCTTAGEAGTMQQAISMCAWTAGLCPS